MQSNAGLFRREAREQARMARAVMPLTAAGDATQPLPVVREREVEVLRVSLGARLLARRKEAA